MVRMNSPHFPAHFSEIRRAAHELETADDLALYLLRIADGIESAYHSGQCPWCVKRHNSGDLPASPCIFGVLD